MNIKELYKKNLKNKKDLKRLGYAGCFGCIKVYPVSQIKEWVDRDQTAICPYCKNDKVIPFDVKDHEEMELIIKQMNKIDKENER